MRRYTLGLSGREFVIDVNELSADSFQVVVGGQTYEVTLNDDENLAEAVITPGYAQNAAPEAAAAARPRSAAPAAAAAAASAPTAAPAPRAAGGGGAGTQKAPMPGVILEVNVKVGDSVKRGQQVAVLDAMKMHNMIGAAKAGVVAEVFVEAGQAVAHGAPIVRITDA